MKKQVTILFSLLSTLLFMGCEQDISHDVIKSNLRPPAYPLITIDPYTSGWSFTDKLYEGSVKHWTGKDFPLLGVIKVDGEFYRFMGEESIELLPIANTGEQGYWEGKYITNQPGKHWMNLDFDDSSWDKGPAAFGTTHNEPTSKTHWDSEFIWVRRVIKLEEDLSNRTVFVEYSHDDDAIIYINGEEVVNTGNTVSQNSLVKLPPELTSSLTKGSEVIMAGYCHNRGANGLLDFGLFVEKEDEKVFLQTAKQKSVDVQATQTHYEFVAGPINLRLTFTAPFFMEDLDLISRPVNYITYNVTSNDGNEHEIEVYFEASPRWAIDQPLQESTAEVFSEGDLVFAKTGSKSQEVLGKKGDDVRIDWGYFYLVGDQEQSKASIGENLELRRSFVNNSFNQNVKSETPFDCLALVQDLGTTSATSGKIMLGYDDLYSIQYFGDNLRPYWNRNEDETILSQFQKANKEYTSLMKRAYTFDKKLMETATQSGGKEYAELCALAYRQAISAHKLVEAPNGDLLFLSKENFSNGSIGTVDITYPSAPLFLYYNVELVKGLMNQIFYYSESGKWTKPFAAHDVGTYPHANGQTYGGDMPIEESGNMLITTAAVAEVEGNAKYAEKHWDVLTTWADYLVEYGLDPEHQLCTDDFAGHFAHNVNLSVKAISGIASYGRLADMLGKKDVAEKYTQKAKDMAIEWEKMANDGDHYKLTFDKPGTWSQKYNLIWNKILKLEVFPAEIAEKELAYYLTKQNEFGLPLDSRETYTKTDWIIWTATLSDDVETFKKFVSPIYKNYNEMTTRVPMSDWIWTKTPTQRGFQARSVVGGFYIKMLNDKINN